MYTYLTEKLQPNIWVKLPKNDTSVMRLSKSKQQNSFMNIGSSYSVAAQYDLM